LRPLGEPKFVTHLLRALAINVRFEQSADRVLHLFEFILAALGAIASQSATCEADGSSSILM